MKCLKCLLPLEAHLEHYGMHKSCFTVWFKTSDSAQFLSLTRRSSNIFSEHANISSQNTSFFHGKFKKYSAELEGSSYILKMRETEAPELPEVEYVCNQIGKILEIPVADFYIVSFDEDKIFVTKNFILHNEPTDLQHIYHFRINEQHSVETLIRVISEKTKRPYDVDIFIKTILFDALIGNHDRHGRNLAFIVTSGKTLLSPIYDNVSYLSLEHGNMLKADFNPTGKICTLNTEDPNMSDYVRELIRLGFKENLHGFSKTVNLPKISKVIQDSFCSDLMKKALITLITKRFKELKNELEH